MSRIGGAAEKETTRIKGTAGKQQPQLLTYGIPGAQVDYPAHQQTHA